MGIFSRWFRRDSPTIADVAAEVMVSDPRIDGWQNVLSGIGGSTYDKRQGDIFNTTLISYDQAMELWRGDDIAARIIETLPSEALREGFDFLLSDDDDNAKDLQEWIHSQWEDLGLVDAIKTAWQYSRGYGGGAILIGVKDGTEDFSEPLNMDAIDEVLFLTALEASEIQPRYWYTDPLQKNFGRPSHYQLNPSSPGVSKDGSAVPMQVQVHESRMIIFDGVQVSRRQATIGGWGDSILNRVWRVLADFNMAYAASGILVHDFAQAVFAIKGLAEIVAMDKGNVLKNRMAAIELGRSVARMVLIDADAESLERKQTPISGLPDLLDRFATRLAASADMPLTLLMGQSPGGLNATGDSDVRFFYDRTKSAQTNVVTPAAEKVTRILLRSRMKEEPDRWSIKHRPLWQATELESAQARKVQAETDVMYITNGVLDTDEVAMSRFRGDEYSFETVVDFTHRGDITPPSTKEENAKPK